MMTSQIVRKLEGRGLLTRTADARDTRMRRLDLTDVKTPAAGVFALLGADQPRFFDALATLVNRLASDERAEAPTAHPA